MPELQCRPLRVFLCHSSHDKPTVRELYERLIAEGWMDAWLDEVKLFPGQDWNFEIEKAVEQADVILVCLTKNSVNKEGYVQCELRIVLDLADYKPEGILFIIPIRLEDCEPPRRLRTWQYADYFPKENRERAYQRLLCSLRMRATNLGLSIPSLINENAGLEANKRVHKVAQVKKLSEKDQKELASKKIQGYEKAEHLEIDKSAVNQPLFLETRSEEVGTAHKKRISSTRNLVVGLLIIIGGLFSLYVGIQKLTDNVPTPTSNVSVDIPVLTSTPGLPTITPSPTRWKDRPWTSPKDGMIMVYVPAGKFIMGSDSSTAEYQEKPAHPVNLDAFWIDQTEVTNAMYAKCVDKKQCKRPRENRSAGRDNYFGNPEFNDYPVIYVSWKNAQDYCTWAERRLPTEAEWEKAARGANALTYPWSNDSPNNNLLNFNGAVRDTTKFGMYPEGASPYGALDMAGNVWEWVNDRYDARYYSASPLSNPPGPMSGQERVIRGGAWNNVNSDVRSTYRRGVDPSSTDDNLGFRCARSE